jgi:hypothetical protein
MTTTEEQAQTTDPTVETVSFELSGLGEPDAALDETMRATRVRARRHQRIQALRIQIKNNSYLIEDFHILSLPD